MEVKTANNRDPIYMLIRENAKANLAIKVRGFLAISEFEIKIRIISLLQRTVA
jgi:hypothetical protein